jgi:hypothetical protein
MKVTHPVSCCASEKDYRKVESLFDGLLHDSNLSLGWDNGRAIFAFIGPLSN